jgi:hypothetical protein
MKTIITIFFLSISSFAFSQKYEKTMQANLNNMNTLASFEEFQVMANKFERIAQAEPDKWLPAYYEAYCYVQSTVFGDMNSDAKQVQLDKAQLIIDELQKKVENESEIYCLQAFVYQLRITDMSKGAVYSSKASEALGKAEVLNSQNPRVYYLNGTNKFYTPKFFGGGPTKAKPYFEKAAELFETFKPANNLMPMWGASHNKEMLQKCK